MALDNNVKVEFDPIKEATKIFEQKTLSFVEEMKRLRAIESDYRHLLTLVTVVAQNSVLTQETTIVVTKAQAYEAESWEDLLRKHFAEKTRSRIIVGAL